MVERRDRARAAAVVGVASIAASWGLVVLGGSRQPGYDIWRDRISPIAAHGAADAWVGIAAILLLALGYACGAVILRDAVRTSVGAGLLAAAAVATAVVALARLDCPGGATGCARNAGGNRLIGPASDNPEGLIHSGAVIVAYGLVAATMLVIAVLWWRRDRRIRSVLSGGAFAASLATVPFWTVGDRPGGVQRLWLGILSAWVVLICAQPLLADAREDRE